MLNAKSLCATDAYLFVLVIIWLLISWLKSSSKSLLAIFYCIVQEYFENFHVVFNHKPCSIWVNSHLNCHVSKPSHVKVQRSLCILKVYLLFNLLICLISSHHLFWLLLTDSLLFSFWYWVYQVLLLLVSLLLTVILRFGFQLFLQL